MRRRPRPRRPPSHPRRQQQPRPRPACGRPSRRWIAKPRSAARARPPWQGEWSLRFLRPDSTDGCAPRATQTKVKTEAGPRCPIDGRDITPGVPEFVHRVNSEPCRVMSSEGLEGQTRGFAGLRSIDAAADGALLLSYGVAWRVPTSRPPRAPSRRGAGLQFVSKLDDERCLGRRWRWRPRRSAATANPTARSRRAPRSVSGACVTHASSALAPSARGRARLSSSRSRFRAPPNAARRSERPFATDGGTLLRGFHVIGALPPEAVRARGRGRCGGAAACVSLEVRGARASCPVQARARA